ncbi:carbohydrate ABC transporter permease [Lederbergia ruris]|uniref:carbohydrate ABC transporter permease n=1 Tax=Lederbergia ruris TaxID=217495 RepID=UPI0039A2B933
MKHLVGNKKNEFLLYIIPALLVFIFTVILPIISSLSYSFYDWDGIGDKKFIGFDHYIRMFTEDPMFWKVFKNNIFFTIIGTVVQIVTGLTLAILLMSVYKFRTTIKVLYFVPCVIASMAISQIFTKLLSINPEGVINYLLGVVGLEHLKTAFLSDPDLTLLIVSLVDAYKFSGIYMVIYFTAFLSISDEIIEAAKIDGCNWWQQYVYIRFPLIKNIIWITVVMLVSGTLKGFDIPYILTNGGPGASSELVSTYMYKTAFNSIDYGYGSALAVFLVIECLVIIGVLGKLFSGGEAK